MSEGPQPDLVILFHITEPGSGPATPKTQLKDQTQKATSQFQSLISILRAAGFHAVARRGQELGHLAVFVKASSTLLRKLIYAERQADFLAHIPLSSPLPPSPDKICSADRIRIIYTYITAAKQDGGLAIAKELPQWDLIESITPLHNKDWNDMWIREWTTHQVGAGKIEGLRKQFGATIATYFSFLSWYTTFLHFPAVLGGIFFFLSWWEADSVYWTYHPLYSTLLLIWGTCWVQWWSAHEKALAIETGHGLASEIPDAPSIDVSISPLNTSFPRRPSYREGDHWYHREFRIFILGIPVIFSFIVLLGSLLTGIFLLEAFVSQLYSGPGATVFPLLPTVLFTLLIPNFVKFSTKFLHVMTEGENHRTRLGWESSMTLKVWALNATVAYLGLFLSAFVYIPFGHGILGMFGTKMGLGQAADSLLENIAQSTVKNPHLDVVQLPGLKSKLNPARLQKQMFAYTVTNQGVNTFMEIGLPWVMKGVNIVKARLLGGQKSNASSKKKVLFEDEQRMASQQEREWLDEVREDIARPPYDVGVDYSEMVMQYGYVVVFSAVWPLAGVMALINNIIELRSDAYKISTHTRRPISTSRVQTIGPWLKSLEMLTWMSACINAALVYIFWVGWDVKQGGGGGEEGSETSPIGNDPAGFIDSPIAVLSSALVVGLLASHAYIGFRYVVRRIMERAVLSKVKRVVRGYGVGDIQTVKIQDEGAPSQFWEYDEGVAEIERIRKEA